VTAIDAKNPADILDTSYVCSSHLLCIASLSGVGGHRLTSGCSVKWCLHSAVSGWLYSIVGQDNEPILQRTHIDCAARKIRHALTYAMWETRIIVWLHNTLFTHLTKDYLAMYLDVLQTLKAKSQAWWTGFW